MADGGGTTVQEHFKARVGFTCVGGHRRTDGRWDTCEHVHALIGEAVYCQLQAQVIGAPFRDVVASLWFVSPPPDENCTGPIWSSHETERSRRDRAFDTDILFCAAAEASGEAAGDDEGLRIELGKRLPADVVARIEADARAYVATFGAAPEEDAPFAEAPMLEEQVVAEGGIEEARGVTPPVAAPAAPRKPKKPAPAKSRAA